MPVTRRKRLIAAAATVLVSLMLLAMPAHADEYPSWSDVEAARASQAATAAEVEVITAAIARLQSDADRLGHAAVLRGVEYTQASVALQRATATADELAARQLVAETQADESAKRLGRLAATLYVTGAADPSIRLLLNSSNSTSLLGQLSAMSVLTRTASRLRAQALVHENLAHSLSQQAKAARAERDVRAAAAAAALAAAQDAARAADAQLASQRAAGETLYAQLASLKNTTAAVEQQYQQGVAARAAAEARQRAAEAAAAADAGPADSSAGGATVNPSGDKAYAAAAMGAYGWGADQFNCLVRLWNQESGWRADAYNTSSGAYGIPQSLPDYKMSSAGSDWRTNGHTQIDWGLGYINGRYGSPCGAWAHEVSNNWY
ncbi:MAG: hypothetical protein ABI255_09010 [Microbacteriaceae bacterium]